MKTKNIFGALAMALLMPAMLLTACSNDKEVTPTIDDNTAKKGYPLQVTINVTRDGDEAPAGSSKTARAHYNGDTKKLEFAEGDKLFVKCYEARAGWFAGTLTWQSEGTFSGTITTENEYSGTGDALFTAATNVNATLLPADYETYDCFSIVEKNGYDNELGFDYAKAFATATTEKTAKAIAIEQFSAEVAYAYSDGIALQPQMAILNFTITGLTANTNVTATLTDSDSDSELISGTVPTNASGEATFAMGVAGGYYNINQLSLTVGGNAITLASGSKTLEAGKVYNVNRSAIPAVGHALASAVIGEVVGTDGLAYNAADRRNLPIGVTPAGVVAYKSGDNGLVLALANKGSMGWGDAVGAGGASAYTPTVTDHSWKLASRSEWRQMFRANGGSETEYPGLNTIIVNAGGSGLTDNYTDYWTSDEYGSDNAYYFTLYDGQYVWFRDNAKTKGCYVRSCFSF